MNMFPIEITIFMLLWAMYENYIWGNLVLRILFVFCVCGGREKSLLKDVVFACEICILGFWYVAISKNYVKQARGGLLENLVCN